MIRWCAFSPITRPISRIFSLSILVSREHVPQSVAHFLNRLFRPLNVGVSDATFSSLCAALSQSLDLCDDFIVGHFGEGFVTHNSTTPGARTVHLLFALQAPLALSRVPIRSLRMPEDQSHLQRVLYPPSRSRGESRQDPRRGLLCISSLLLREFSRCLGLVVGLVDVIRCRLAAKGLHALVANFVVLEFGGRDFGCVDDLSGVEARLVIQFSCIGHDCARHLSSPRLCSRLSEYSFVSRRCASPCCCPLNSVRRDVARGAISPGQYDGIDPLLA